MYNLGDAVGYIRLEMGRFLQEAQQASSSTQQIENEFKSLESVSKKLEGVIVSAFAAIGAAIVGGLGKAVQVGSQFEASMSQVAATMGMTSDEILSGTGDFEKLSQAAMQMGETTKFSASQAADALNYLALAGYNTEQAISTLPTVLNLAASGGMDLARASDMITDAASALGLGIDDMALFADKMAKAAQSSNTSVSQLGDAILQIGGTAKYLEGGVTELNTALGILANNGIKAAEGGTALRQIILNLTAPTDKAKKYMEELGLKVKDVQGNVRPLNDIFKDLDEILQGKGITGSADRIEALAQIFDARQLKSAEALLNNYGESWDRLYEKIDNADGAASTMANTMETNLKGALTILGSTAEGVGITVYNSIENSFKKAVEEATKQLSNLNEAFKSSEMQEALVKISDAISKMIVKLSEFISEVLPKLVSGFANLVDNFDKISAFIAGFITTLGLAKAGMIAFKIQTDLVTQSLIAQKIAALAANAALLANPYTAVAVAVGVLVTALIGLYTEQKNHIEQLDKVNEKYYEQKSAIDDMTLAYNKQLQTAEEIKQSRDEEIDKVKNLVSIIEKNVDETGKIISNTNLVKDAIDELNTILPVNIDYQNDQITNYSRLVTASQDYCEQLKNEALLEARQEEYKTAVKAYDEAIEKREELTNSFYEAQTAYNKVRDAYEKFQSGVNNYDLEMKKKAEEANMSYSKYINAALKTTENGLNAAQDAYLENERIIQDTSARMEHAETRILELNNNILANEAKYSEDVTGIFTSESEARIGVAQLEAERIAEINRQAHQEQIDEIQDNADEIIDAEKDLEAALEELEIQYNTGVIQSDEEYHAKRLELLNEFHGEWSKKSSSWLKSELDWEQRQKDAAIQEEERQREKEQREAEQAAREAERQREQEQREKEQAAREEERLYKEKINKEIEELDRRKKREENYTDEQYLADLTALRDRVDKENELWQQLDDKIFDYQKQVTENNKRELAQQERDTYNAIKDKKELEKEYSLQDYVSDLKEFLNTLDETSEIYADVKKEIIKSENQITENMQKEVDNRKKIFYDDLKAKLETDEDYTQEMYIQDLQAFSEYLDKESDLYKDVQKEIIKTQKEIQKENDKIADENQKAADSAFKSWESGFNSLKAEAETAYNEVINKQKSLENKLNGEIELYESKTKKVLNLTTGLWEDAQVKETSAKYLEKQTKELEEYQDKLQRLSDRGISDDLMQQILGMDEKSAKEYVSALENMSDESLKAYDTAYTNLKAKNKEFSEKYYADELKAFETEWGDKITAYIDTLPPEAQKAAQSLIDEFVSGLNTADFSAMDNSFEKMFSGFTADFKKDILNGSIFENYGLKSIQILQNELNAGENDLVKTCQNLGEKAANKFIEAYRNVFNSVGSMFGFSMPINNFGVNADSAMPIATVDTTNTQALTKNDLIDAIKQAMPSGDVILNVDGNIFGKIARNSLNHLAQQSGRLGLHI